MLEYIIAYTGKDTTYFAPGAYTTTTPFIM